METNKLTIGEYATDVLNPQKKGADRRNKKYRARHSNSIPFFVRSYGNRRPNMVTGMTYVKAICKCTEISARFWDLEDFKDLRDAFAHCKKCGEREITIEEY